MIASDIVVYTTVRAAPKYALIAERNHTAGELRRHLIVSDNDFFVVVGSLPGFKKMMLFGVDCHPPGEGAFGT